MPLVPCVGASTLQRIGIILPELQPPLPDGFMGDVDAAFEQQLLARRGGVKGSDKKSQTLWRMISPGKR